MSEFNGYGIKSFLSHKRQYLTNILTWLFSSIKHFFTSNPFVSRLSYYKFILQNITTIATTNRVKCTQLTMAKPKMLMDNTVANTVWVIEVQWKNVHRRSLLRSKMIGWRTITNGSSGRPQATTIINDQSQLDNRRRLDIGRRTGHGRRLGNRCRLTRLLRVIVKQISGQR